jgi:hypothetical protein
LAGGIVGVGLAGALFMSNRSRLLSNTILSGFGSAFLTSVTGHVANADAALSYAFDKMAYKAVAPNFSAPAVDGVNGKIGAFGGSFGRKAGAGLEGTLQIPAGHAWGIQFDPRVGRIGGHTFGELGFHMFTRNPNVGLAGLYVNHVHLDQFGGAHATNVSFEGEYYFGRWTFQGIFGVEFGNSASSTTTAVSVINNIVTTTTFIQGYDVKTRFTDQFNLKYYITENWSGFVGHRYQGGKHAFALGTEAVVPLAPNLATTLFAEGRLAEGNASGVWGGMRYYFGHKGKSLIKRNRENDDPPGWNSNLFTLFANSTNVTTQKGVCPPNEVLVDGVCQLEPG